MKTILRGLALAAIFAAAGALWPGHSVERGRVFQRPEPLRGHPARRVGGVPIRGQVLHGGLAVPGASVAFVPNVVGRRDVLITSPTVWRATTGADGRFELAGIPSGPGRLAAISEALAPSFVALEVPAGPLGVDVMVLLEAGVPWAARVLSGDLPVAKARVSVWMAAAAGWLLEGRPLREGTTDAEGRFRLEGLPTGRPLRLLVRAEGFRPFERVLSTPEGAPDRIDLDPGLAAWGRVVTSDGLPLVDAEVSVSQGGAYLLETRSDAQGVVQLGGLEARGVTLWIQKDGYAPTHLDLADPSSEWTVVLRRTGGLEGRVAPDSGAAWLVVEAAGATYRRPLGADGAFRWEGLPPGPAEARATDEPGRVLARKKVEIPEGEVAAGILLSP